MSLVLRNQCRDLWRRLRDENAPLRILREGTLASAPILFFDSIVMSHATPEWQKAAFVIGKALVDIWDSALHQTDDLEPFWIEITHNLRD